MTSLFPNGHDLFPRRSTLLPIDLKRPVFCTRVRDVREYLFFWLTEVRKKLKQYPLDPQLNANEFYYSTNKQ